MVERFLCASCSKRQPVLGRRYCRVCFQNKPYLKKTFTNPTDYYEKRTQEWFDEHGDERDRPSDIDAESEDGADGED